jgi:flagellar L-ring protein FlgH
MIRPFAAPFRRLLPVALAAALLGGCNAVQRISEIGAEPALSTIQNPVAQRDYQPVALPMPRPESMEYQANSLWRPGSRAFFKDQRANRVGDILTVAIDLADEANITNESTRSRSNSENADLTNFLGYEGRALAQILPEGVSPENLLNFGSETSNAGRGAVNREESIKLTIAAIITQVLPNGNLVLRGTQEVRVNFETRVLTITGVIRPEDISASNRVNHTQIAEARISYGGRGQITDVQQPRYGQQLFDVVFPF